MRWISLIECLNNDKKLEGYIDGKRYLDRKKKVWGYLEGNIAKDKEGYPLLILREDGMITWNEGEEQGYMKENKIFLPNNELLYEFLKDKRLIQNSQEEIVLQLVGTTREIEELGNLDFFGIAAVILELFA